MNPPPSWWQLKRAALCVVLGLIPLVPQAQTSWKGTVSSDWRNPANWTAGTPTAAIEAVVGDAQFTGPNEPSISAKAACKSLTIGAGSRAVTLTVAKALSVSGSITIGSNGSVAHGGNGVLSLTGDWINAGNYTANNNRATVNFAGKTQGITGPTTFRRLSISAGSRTLLHSSISVIGQLTVSGTLEPEESPVTTVSGNGKLTVSSGGALRVKAPTFAGNFALSGQTTLNAGSTVDYCATAVGQTVSSSLTYSTLRISGGTTKTLGGNLPALNASSAAAGNLVVAEGVLDLGAYTANRGVAVAGGSLTVSNGAALWIGGVNVLPANYATRSFGLTSTVAYRGGDQVVARESYGNLLLTSGGSTVTKSLAAGDLTIGVTLTTIQGAGAGLTVNAAGPVTVRGDAWLGSGTTFNGGSFAHTYEANFTNDGTFNGATGSIVFPAPGSVISGSGTNDFNDVVVAGAGVMIAGETALSVRGNLSTIGTGTLTQPPGIRGAVTLAGAGKQLLGSGLSFHHLVVSGSITTAASFVVGGNLRVLGSLTASGGTLTLAGPSQTIDGSGTLSLFALHVSGGVTTARGFAVASDFAVTGTFTASSGAIVFPGVTTFSGAADLFDATVSGTALTLGAGAVLGIAGELTVAAGTFDTSSSVPNTVAYNGTAAQNVLGANYHHLALAGTGPKSALGPVQVGGDVTIEAGATWVAGNYRHAVAGNWANRGAFLGAGSTLELLGAADAAIRGPTTFDKLTVNKASPANVVRLFDSISAAELTMTSGTLLTGTQAVTITADRQGPGIILGTIIRSHPFQPGTAYAFEGPNNTIWFAGLTSLTSITVRVTSALVLDFPFGGAMNREYEIALAGAASSLATLRLHYEDAERNGNDESRSQLWHYQNPWGIAGKTGDSDTQNWIELSGLTELAGRWTMSDNAAVVRWTGAISSAWENPANWSAVQGSPQLPPSTNEIVELGRATFVHPPTIASPVRIRALSFGSVRPVSLTLVPGGSLDLSGSGGQITGNWTQDASHLIQVGDQSLVVGGILQLSDGTNGHCINLAVGSGSVTVGDDLVQSGGASITFSGGGQLSLGGNFTRTSGAFVPATSRVTYNGSGAQAVAGGIAYHDLVVNKSSGAAVLAAPTSIGANLTLTGAGSLVLAAPVTVASNVVIEPGALLDGGSATVTLGGHWVLYGAFVPSQSMVIFNGTRDQTVTGGAFSDLRVDKAAGALTLTGALTLNGNLELAAGTLDLSTFTANRSAFGGTMTAASQTTLRIGSGSAFPSGFAQRSIADDSTVVYSGSGAQVVTENAYGNLVLLHGGSNPKTLVGATAVAGDLLIGGDATFDAGSSSLVVRGSWTNQGVFIPATSAVTLAGASRALSGATSFRDLTVSGSYAADANLTVNGRAVVTGSLAVGSATVTFAGDVASPGAFRSSGIVNFLGTTPQLIALGAGFVSSGTVSFAGTLAPTFTSAATPTFHDVNILNSAGIAPSVGWTIDGDFTVGAGALFVAGNAEHLFRGSVVNHGRVSSSGALRFTPSAAATVRLTGESFESRGVVSFGGTGLITLEGGSQAFESVTIENTHPAGITPVSNWALAGNLLIAAGASLKAGTGLTHTMAANWSNDGSFDGQGSTVVLGGLTDLAGTGSTTFNHLLISGTVMALSDFAVAGDFTNNGSFDGGGSTVSFVGTGPSTIGGATSPALFDGLTVAKAPGAVVRLGVPLDGLNALSVSGGTLDAAANAMTQDPLGGTLRVEAGATLRLGGTSSLPAFTTVTLDPASTVEYYGSGSQTISAANYGSLVSSGAGPRVLSTVGAIGVAGTFSPGSNAYTVAGSALNFNGSSAQTIPAFNYHNLMSSGTGTRLLAPTGSIDIAGTFAPGANPYSTAGSTVQFSGAAQSIPPFGFHHLTLGGSGTKTLAGDITVGGNLQLASSGLADAGFTATLRGNVLNNTTHSGTGRMVLRGGTVPHQLSGAGSYANLELDDASGAVLDQGNLLVNGTLNLTSGILVSGTNRVVIGSGGTVGRVAGHVAGRLQKTIAAGPTARTFEIGDGMSYTPIAVTFGNVTSTGTLTAFTVPSDSPQLAAAGIVTARSVNRSWNLSASGVAFNTYQATLAFVSTDLDPGADPNRFVMAVGAAGTWVLPTVLSRTGTSIQAVGLTGFGDLAVGEPAAPGLFTGIAIGTNGIPSLTFSGNPGQSYRIQAATNLNHPITWIDLATATPAADGVVHVDDTLAAGYPMRFYRSVTP